MYLLRTNTCRRIFQAAMVGALFMQACSKAPPPPAPAKPREKPAAPVLNPHLRAMAEDYDRFFAAAMTMTETPGAAVVIVKDSQIVFQRGYGLKLLGTADSVDIHTVFRIGSLSKGFAGVLTGMLVQDGRMAWDEPVQRRFPEFQLQDQRQAQRIRLKHLLSHTTGLTYHAYTNLIEEGVDLSTIVRQYYPRTPLFGKEGTVYSYQNVAFCVIEEVMRAAMGGESYTELMAERIFRPAGMTTASCDFESMRRNPDKALPHFRIRSGWRADTISPLYYNFAAAGGVNASIADMGQWLKLLLGHQPALVADTTLDRVFRPVISTDRERHVFPDWIRRNEAFYALGWRVLEHGGDTIVYHGGYVNGFRGEIALNRRDGIAICVLFNAHTELGKECIPAFFERWRARRDGVLRWKEQ